MTRGGGLFALDLATSTGFAHAEPGGRIYSGTKRFAGYKGQAGRQYLALYEWLDEMLALLRPKVLIWEAPITRGGDLNKVLLLVGLSGVVDLLGAKHDVAVTEILHYATLKKSFTGSGNATKADMIATAKLRGFDPKTDDEADAIALLCYAAGRHKMPVQWPR